MAESQAKTRERASAVEPQDSLGGLGEPGIADRKTPDGAPWEGDHPINLRLSIPLLFKRYYVSIVAGEERRSPERRVEERQKHPIKTIGNLTVLLAAGTVVGISLFTLVQVVGHWVLMQTGWVQP